MALGTLEGTIFEFLLRQCHPHDLHLRGAFLDTLTQSSAENQGYLPAFAPSRLRREQQLLSAADACLEYAVGGPL
jgi:hypothetical protein